MSFERQNVSDYATEHWSSLVSTLTAAMWIKSSAAKLTLFTFGSTTDAMLQFNIEDATRNGFGISAGVSYWQANGSKWAYVNFFFIKITRLFVVFDRNSFSMNNPIRV